MRSPLPFRPKPAEAAPREATCLNCGAFVVTKFCPECSQENEPLNLGIGHVLKDAVEEVIKVDSKLFCTIGPLFTKPGFLTQEWSRGRRVSYISPFKLYLFATFFFFLAASWNVSHGGLDTLKDPSVTVREEAEAEPPAPAIKTQNLSLEAQADEVFTGLDRRLGHLDMKQAVQGMIDNLGSALFVFLPAFAFALKLFYVRRGRYYVEHLVFSLHTHAFYFIVLAVLTVIPWQWNDLTGFAICSVYSILALKRYYGQSWPKTLLKGSLLGCGYLFLLTLTLIGAFIAGVMTMPEEGKDEKPKPASSAPSATLGGPKKGPGKAP